MSTVAKPPAPPKPKGPPAALKVAVAVVIGLVLIGLSLFLLVGQFASLAVRPGFFGTRAGLFADINLVLQIVLLLGLTVGYGLAVGGQITAHQYNQTFWALFNIVLVMFIMVVSFFRQVVPGIPEQLLTARLATALIHSLLGGLTVACAVYILLRMNGLLPKFLRIKWWKNLMRVTLALYWLVGLFGIGTYYFFYVRALPAGAVGDVGDVPPGTAVVPVANYTFNPGVLNIPVGTIVVFRNDDPDPHTVTSDDGAFEEGVLEEKQEHSVTFSEPGEYNYFCLYHGAAGGIGMAARIVVGEATAEVVIPTAVAPPAPTTEPRPEEPPAAPLGADAVGFAFIRDGEARSDEVEVSLTGLPADTGGDLHLWLTGDGDPLSLASVQPADGAAGFVFTDPAGSNLLAQYSGFLLSVEASGSSPTVPSTQVLIQNAIPAGALGPVRQLLVASDDAPEQQAYTLGLIRMSEELYRHAKAVNGAALIGDFDGMNRHIEHMLTLIQGQGGPDYRDFDGDGHIHDPGDGYGILRYADAVTAQAQAALAAPDGTENVKIHAGHLLILANNMHTWGEEVVDLVIRAHQATAAADQQALASEAQTVTRRMLDGFDANGNGAIEPIPGEGGAFTLYFHSQYMATVGATAREGSGITVPVVTPTGEAAATAAPTSEATSEPAATAAPGATEAPAATDAPPTAVPPTATTAAQATLAPLFITYNNFNVVPAQNVAKVGQQIVFLIRDSVHQPYAGASAPFIFEAPNNLGDGTQFSITFNTAQTLTILCGFHPNMSGTLVIEP